MGNISKITVVDAEKQADGESPRAAITFGQRKLSARILRLTVTSQALMMNCTAIRARITPSL
jgi:hypothetical protein